MASLDYSRFANIGDSDDSSDDEGMTIKSSSAQPPHQALPSDLSKRLQEMASHPGALENFDAEIEAIKQAALKQKSSPGELGEDAGAAALGAPSAPVAAPPPPFRTRSRGWTR